MSDLSAHLSGNDRGDSSSLSSHSAHPGSIHAESEWKDWVALLKPRVMVHEPGVPRDEALLLDLEHEPDLGIRRSLPTTDLGYMVPPLWGKDSFNNGAGMARLITAAERANRHR